MLFSGTPLQSKPARNRKRVRISEDAPLVRRAETVLLSDDERQQTWWSASEFHSLKTNLRQECKRLRKEISHSDSLSYAYNLACLLTEQAAASEPSSVVQDDLSCDVVSQEASNTALMGWFQFAIRQEGSRGLEGYSSKMHALRRQRHLQESKHVVFLEQARQFLANQRDDYHLAVVAAMASRRARSFAVLLGHTDAYAAVHGNSKSGMARHGWPQAVDEVVGSAVDQSVPSAKL